MMPLIFLFGNRFMCVLSAFTMANWLVDSDLFK